MEEIGMEKGEHSFSVELRSREYLKNISLSNSGEHKVLIEGFLGELEEIGLVEGVMVEIKGADGVLRIELKEEELKKLLPKGGLAHHV